MAGFHACFTSFYFSGPRSGTRAAQGTMLNIAPISHLELPKKITKTQDGKRIPLEFDEAKNDGKKTGIK